MSLWMLVGTACTVNETTGLDDSNQVAACPSSGGQGGPTGRVDNVPFEESTYSILVPRGCEGPFPVVFSLHGSGMSGGEMVSFWTEFAESSCLAVVGLSAADGHGWSYPEIETVYALVEEIDRRYDIDTCGRYLHGYSLGAVFTYMVGPPRDDLFAGISAYAGSIAGALSYGSITEETEPIAMVIAHGTDDTVMPFSEAEYAYEVLSDYGWPAVLWPDDGGTHSYNVAHHQAVWDGWSDLMRSTSER